MSLKEIQTLSSFLEAVNSRDQESMGPVVKKLLRLNNGEGGNCKYDSIRETGDEPPRAFRGFIFEDALVSIKIDKNDRCVYYLSNGQAVFTYPPRLVEGQGYSFKFEVEQNRHEEWGHRILAVEIVDGNRLPEALAIVTSGKIVNALGRGVPLDQITATLSAIDLL